MDFYQRHRDKYQSSKQAERQRPPHLPGQNITNEQGTYDPEAIKKFQYNVAEAQLELHRQNMEWCIGTIAEARNRHVDVEPEVDERPDLIWWNARDGHRMKNSTQILNC